MVDELEDDPQFGSVSFSVDEDDEPVAQPQVTAKISSDAGLTMAKLLATIDPRTLIGPTVFDKLTKSREQSLKMSVADHIKADFQVKDDDDKWQKVGAASDVHIDYAVESIALKPTHPKALFADFIAVLNNLEGAYGFCAKPLVMPGCLVPDRVHYTLAIPTMNPDKWKVAWMEVTAEFLANAVEPVQHICRRLEMDALDRQHQLIYERNMLPHDMQFFQNGEEWDGK